MHNFNFHLTTSANTSSHSTPVQDERAMGFDDKRGAELFVLIVYVSLLCSTMKMTVFCGKKEHKVPVVLRTTISFIRVSPSLLNEAAREKIMK